MPTAPDPNSPFLEGRVQAEFGRIPGMPTSVGKPTPQAGDLSFPAPPAPAMAPIGRPPAGEAPTPAATPAGAPPVGGAAPAQAKPAGAQQAPTPTGGTQPVGAQAQPALPPGTMTTPSMDPTTGEVKHTLTPEGQERYRAAVLQTRQRLGQVPSVFKHPNLPEMEVIPGRWNFNPFTGTWSK